MGNKKSQFGAGSAETIFADPRITPVDLPAGSLAMYIPSPGEVMIFCKLDDGSSTNVELIATQNINSSPTALMNYSLKTSIDAGALTITLTGQGDTALSANNKAFFGLRDATITDGDYNIRQISDDITTVISSGSTSGFADGGTYHLYIYAIDNSGTIELAWSGNEFFDEGDVHTTVAEGGAGAADTIETLYSTAVRSNVPVRLIGRMEFSLTTAGTWELPDKITLLPFIELPVKFHISKTGGNQVIGTNTLDLITWDGIESDTHNGVDLSNNEYVCQIPGDYDIKIGVSWILTAQIEHRLELQKNGTTIFTHSIIPGFNDRGSHGVPVHVEGLIAGDTLQIRVIVNFATRQISGDFKKRCWFQGQRRKGTI